MNISEMIKAQSGKRNKELAKEIYTNGLTIARVLVSIAIAVVLTYQLKFIFEYLYTVTYPFNHFVTTMAVAYVFIIFTFTIMYSLKFVIKISTRLRVDNK
ncbi:hypothetical protein [Staphylococcus equorum]|nr:hypothetical protein [Staphylococcus equorum]